MKAIFFVFFLVINNLDAQNNLRDNITFIPLDSFLQKNSEDSLFKLLGFDNKGLYKLRIIKENYCYPDSCIFIKLRLDSSLIKIDEIDLTHFQSGDGGESSCKSFLTNVKLFDGIYWKLIIFNQSWGYTYKDDEIIEYLFNASFLEITNNRFKVIPVN